MLHFKSLAGNASVPLMCGNIFNIPWYIIFSVGLKRILNLVFE